MNSHNSSLILQSPIKNPKPQEATFGFNFNNNLKMTVKLSSVLLVLFLFQISSSAIRGMKPIVLDEISRRRREMGAVSHVKQTSQKFPVHTRVNRNLNQNPSRKGTVEEVEEVGYDDAGIDPEQTEEATDEHMVNGDELSDFQDDTHVDEELDEGTLDNGEETLDHSEADFENLDDEFGYEGPAEEEADTTPHVSEDFSGEPVEQEEEALEDEEEVNEMTEADEIKAALVFVEYKLDEIHNLITECVEKLYQEDILIPYDKVLENCTGYNLQILFMNFKESMRRVKDIFMTILRKKMLALDSDYEDEVEFFLDVLENFIDKDFKLNESLEISKKYCRYYVSPRFYDSLLEIAAPEIDALNAIHHRLKVKRKNIRVMLKDKLNEQNKHINELNAEAHELTDGGEGDEEDSSVFDHSFGDQEDHEETGDDYEYFDGDEEEGEMFKKI